MTRVHTPEPRDERGTTRIRYRWSRSTVGIDPVMIGLLAFACTILIRVALAGGQ